MVVCLWGKIKKGGKEAEKEGDIREIREEMFGKKKEM